MTDTVTPAPEATYVYEMDYHYTNFYLDHRTIKDVAQQVRDDFDLLANISPESKAALERLLQTVYYSGHADADEVAE